MASTTKSWTLHVVVHAIQGGYVSLNDQVTISANAGCTPCTTVPGGSSLMGVTTGEIVKFADLLRGMMYPSGNDAAIAVAEHVAKKKYGPSATYQDFINEMNTSATALGLTNTHFTNPAGLDTFLGDTSHHTTAREMAIWWNHAIPDQLYRDVVGFSGTYAFTTQLPGGGTKAYSFGWGVNYPGWEGKKVAARPSAMDLTTTASSPALTAWVVESCLPRCRATWRMKGPPSSITASPKSSIPTFEPRARLGVTCPPTRSPACPTIGR
jgi:D-alanyl-D-alanine carboxypeptidase